MRGLKTLALSVGRVPLRVARVEGPLHLAARALREEGWLRTYRTKQPVSRTGDPLPWYTYAALHFLAQRLPHDALVFEYGAGFSTLWYAARARRVISVESDPAWTERVAQSLPANAQVVYRPQAGDDYVREIGAHEARFDLVAIDGLERAACGHVAPDHLSDGGVVVWDNSDREEFAETWEAAFAPLGFREIPFRGLGPILPNVWTTSILYRPGNCLGI